MTGLAETVQFAISTKDELEDGAPDPPTPDSWPRQSSAPVPERERNHRRLITGNGRAGVSQAFLTLVDQLVHQHRLEVAGFRPLKSFDLPKCPTTDMERLVSQASEAEGRRPHRKSSSSSHEDSFGSTERTTHHLARSPTVAKVMCHHHGDLKEMHASKLLDAFDMQKLLEDDEEDEVVSAVMRPLRTNASFQTFDWEEMEKESWFTRLQVFMQSTRYEFTISVILAINVLWMAFELELEGGAAGVVLGVYDRGITLRDWKYVFLVGDHIFAYIFILDVIVRLLVLQRKFFQVCLNYVDIAVSITSLAEVVLTNESLEMPVPPVLFKLLRIGKLARAIRMIQMTTMLLSLQLLIKCLTASRGMLFWSFCLMSFVQCVAGMILATLCQDFIQDPTNDPKIREAVFRYYGTFTRTILSMFEILFANWAPACRILVENVNEWFTVFFLIYRCVLGFAVINVVNSVFVQQTMKTASSDEDLAFRQKQKDIAAYTRKVRKLFQTMDASGDGTINLEEFSKLVTNPKLNFWMSQLELEYHDLMSLFEFLDNGDGEITLTEFIEGAAKLRGQAKALDIWRMETKVEVLFEEVLNMLRATPIAPVELVEVNEELEISPPLTRTSSVQEILANSAYKHIGRASRPAETPPPGQEDVTDKTFKTEES